MAKTLNYISLFLAQILLATAQIEKVNVTVYYETLCPYAKSFVVNQLRPVLQTNLSRYINLDMIPYGKSNTTSDANGNLTFTCHHKQVECFGNQIQACALTTINSGQNTDNLGYNSETVDFIVCFMKGLTPQSSHADVEAALDRCTDSNTALLVRNCTGMDFGKKYLAHLGTLTDQFQKPLNNVPTIVFNGKFDKTESEQSERDFERTVCSKLGKNPSECSDRIGSGDLSATCHYSLLNMGVLLLGFWISL